MPTAASAKQDDKCGGRLSFGEIAACSSIADEQQHVFTFNTRQDADTIYPRLKTPDGDSVSASISGPDGVGVCAAHLYATPCRLGAAGKYTVTVSMTYGTGTNSYRLAIESTRTPSECTRLDSSFFSFASPGVPGTVPLGAAADCYRFSQPTGSVLYLRGLGGASMEGQILDANYETVCVLGYTRPCTLTGPAPYRAFVLSMYGDESAYTLRMPRLSQSVGCQVTRPTTFGDPGDGAVAGTLTAEGLTCHKVKAPKAGAVAVRVDPDQDVLWTLYDDAGQQVCSEYPSPRYCRLPVAGNYTMLMENQNTWGDPVNYQLAIPALYANAGCEATTGTSWDLPTLLVHQTSRVQTNCQPIRGNAGDRIITYSAPTVYSQIITWLVDSTGGEACPDWTGEDGCVLPATGTYRVLSYVQEWGEQGTDATYRMQVRRLSSPAGCPTRTTGPYGAVPVPSGVRCRILEVPTPGTYLVNAVSADNEETYAHVFDSQGLSVCGSPQCTFTAPGRYTMVLQGRQTYTVIDNSFEYATVFLGLPPSGCAEVSDDAAQITAHSDVFNGAGQVQCLKLASPAGAKVIELVPGDATGAGRPDVTVVDSTGAYVCDSSYSLRQASCELTGTAPFFAVIRATGGNPTGPYTTAFPRVDGTPACAVLPRTAEGATFDTSADRFATCFSIPADEHAAREVFTVRRTAGTGGAAVSIFDSTGIRYCQVPSSADRTFTCSLPAGPVTVIVEAHAADATFQLTHRAA
ncbi:hypothetical protein GCM10023170_051450 [Phytohabitans houttuyneae]|uniref:Uncharacterized protein n=1 Tax=Phytohabitans houttuyneae TaxID=1076126 RepID=A0A6V8KMY5_9ACTN|nr:hypothetical protein Phou_094140 [Phytohabitans houttuyneae]